MLPAFGFISLLAAAQLPEKTPPPTATKTAAAPAAAASPAPKYRYVVLPEGNQHLGSMGPVESRVLIWELKNQSDRPLSFRVLDTAPGVKVAEAPFSTPWLPGESRKIEVTTEATSFLGYQKRAVRLEPDDLKEPRYILRWDMVVRPEMAVDAANKTFGEVAPHESPMLSFAFTREAGGAAEIHLDSKLPEYLESEVVAQGSKATLQFTLRPSRLKPGVQAGLELLKVSTNAPRQPTFDLTLAWKLKLPIFAVPSRVVWDDPSHRTFQLTVKSSTGKPFKILEAHIEGPKRADDQPLFSCGPLPEAEAATQVISLQCGAELESRGSLFLTCTGLDGPLQVPLAWLPPKAAAKTQKQ